MKKYSFILWAALAMVSVFTACTNEDSLVIEQTEAKTVTIRATIDGDLGSRVTLEDDAENRVVKVDWAEGDAFKITVNNKDYTFVYNPSTGAFEYDNSQDATFPETFTSAGTVTAIFPATAPEEYDNQSGALEGAAAFLTMTAMLEVTEGQSTENLALNFKHNNSIVKLTLKNDAFKENSVTSVALKSGSNAVVTASGDFAGDTNGNILVYFAVAPQDMEDIWIHAVCENKDYVMGLSDKELQSGKLYNVNKTMEPLFKTAEQAVKGDFAMADGRFVSVGNIDYLTNEHKNGVAGVVFWTETEEGPSTLVGENAADKIMQEKFPNCTHGLIVALTNASTNCVWQGVEGSYDEYGHPVDAKYYESIYETFQEKHETYKNYAAVQSGFQGNVDKILGFNNTEVLEAYNKYCIEENRDEYLVKSIEALDIWKRSNTQITNTTGWYFPSCKELHLLHFEDVNNIQNYTKGNTADIVNQSLKKIDGNLLSTQFEYWSSTELSDPHSSGIYGFYVTVKDFGGACKFYPLYLRAVCAF